MTDARRRKLQEWLRPYQRRFIADQARRIIVLKARQIGMSEAAAIRALREASGRSYHDVFVTSLSHREAKELLRKVATWVKILGHFNRAYRHAEVTATKITLPNGSRILALPAKAVRSRSGTIILDEYALQMHDRDIWAAISPAAETQDHLRIIVISTPFGRSGVFHDIWTDPKGQYGEWSRHKIDVFDAVDEGFPVDPDDLRGKYPTDVWQQEFLCQFGSDTDQYFPHHLLRASQVPQTPDVVDLRAVGIDLASENHASTMVPATMRDELRYVEAPWTIKEAGQSRRYSDQYEDITDDLDHTAYDRIAVDGTGEGAQISQDLREEYEGVTVWKSGDWKNVTDTVQAMRRDMEDDRLFLADDANLLRAFARVRKRERSDKSWRFEAKEDEHGHADEFFAAVMAVDALTDKRRAGKPAAGGLQTRY